MRFGLILGDQLHHQLATLKALDRTRDVILMAEVVEEADLCRPSSAENCPDF